MRIITGSARGAKLKAPKGQNTRPTADRIKESLFNILGAFVYDKNVLDMFSGTGNLALEALSRGASHATMVDTALESISIIKFNTAHTKLNDKATILKSDIFTAIKKFHQNKMKFDIIFCDPPYHKELCMKSLQILHEYPVLSDDGIIIMEHALEDILPDKYEEFSLLRRQKYGSTTQISIYENTKIAKSEE